MCPAKRINLSVLNQKLHRITYHSFVCCYLLFMVSVAFTAQALLLF